MIPRIEKLQRNQAHIQTLNSYSRQKNDYNQYMRGLNDKVEQIYKLELFRNDLHHRVYERQLQKLELHQKNIDQEIMKAKSLRKSRQDQLNGSKELHLLQNLLIKYNRRLEDVQNKVKKQRQQLTLIRKQNRAQKTKIKERVKSSLDLDQIDIITTNQSKDKQRRRSETKQIGFPALSRCKYMSKIFLTNQQTPMAASRNSNDSTSSILADKLSKILKVGLKNKQNQKKATQRHNNNLIKLKKLQNRLKIQSQKQILLGLFINYIKTYFDIEGKNLLCNNQSNVSNQSKNKKQDSLLATMGTNIHKIVNYMLKQRQKKQQELCLLNQKVQQFKQKLSLNKQSEIQSL